MKEGLGTQKPVPPPGRVFREHETGWEKSKEARPGFFRRIWNWIAGLFMGVLELLSF